jgi:phytoene dehydrogenase-like protein
MPNNEIPRREFIKSVLGGMAVVALDWNSFPRGSRKSLTDNQFDAVIIGSGLGGLSCAAAFARQGFKPLVLEQHDKPGGYATTFARPGGFVFDVSLHSTTVGERNGLHNLIPGFPEITDVEFLPHPHLYRAIFPDYDIRVPQKDLKGYIGILIGYFPEEKEGIAGLFDDMKGLSNDIGRLSAARGQTDMSRFPTDYPYLFKCYNKTWGDMVNARLKDPKLIAIISGLWGYFGLPPSKLSSFYYALPTYSYLTSGGFYPRGKSQKISNSFVKFIEEHGGKVMLNKRVEEIVVKDHSAQGVRTADGETFTAKVVVSNACAIHTFRKMMNENEYLSNYLSKIDKYSVSLSCFQVFLGLKEDLVKKIGVPDSEIFIDTGYDPESSYDAALKGDVEDRGCGVTLYDNIYEGYSPPGKNTINIITLQGYDHWKKYEEDYFKGNKAEYRAEKERIAGLLIAEVEKKLLPGLTNAIEVKDIASPLTNVRYTSNYRGAIYGWDQTVDNSGQNRLSHKTPIKNLYLSGAWTRPGHGYGAVVPSGLECFGEIMQNW